MKIQSVCIPQGELLPGEVMPNRNRKSSSVLQKSCKKKKKKKAIPKYAEIQEHFIQNQSSQVGGTAIVWQVCRI